MVHKYVISWGHYVRFFIWVEGGSVRKVQRLVDWAPAAQDCWLSSRRRWIFMSGECAKSATASRLGACGARLLAKLTANMDFYEGGVCEKCNS